MYGEILGGTLVGVLLLLICVGIARALRRSMGRSSPTAANRRTNASEAGTSRPRQRGGPAAVSRAARGERRKASEANQPEVRDPRRSRAPTAASRPATASSPRSRPVCSGGSRRLITATSGSSISPSGRSRSSGAGWTR
ncbi:hypothetical protein [Halalkalicoccus salilacus]|uniref:hypothetical protein n=1 Tax=Halalkalicoccus sp. GCM10025704 TaxID=3252662 RepID=UPI0036241EEE